MKNLIKLLAIPAIALVMTSCDDVKEDDRYIDMGKLTPQRTVLLEEFTGQGCTNCPQGHKIASDLKARYGANFIPVSIHASSLATPEASGTPDYPGLSNSEGEALYSAAGRPALPAGVIDRRTAALDRSEWATSIIQDIRLSAPLKLTAAVTYDAATETFNVKVDAGDVTEAVNGKLSVWMLQSNIKSLQLNGGNYELDYIHNHVFRGSLNTVSGETFSVAPGETFAKTYSIKMKPTWKVTGWKATDFSVVAFVEAGGSVIEANEGHVTE